MRRWRLVVLAVALAAHAQALSDKRLDLSRGDTQLHAASLIKEFAVDEFASGNDLLADAIGIGANAALQFSWRF